ncbi:hypothetical protein B9Z19DRAFT_1129661 [Tuber borchii]|uniref:Uncharacterized protein n=1 Tax=Tuber borchii TaxID=42251 RepID=A0A2T6ZLY2_TUBBO|nr:hypothetical protein B9Z19DRAFT_1129661 [Tuber borchii]
MHMLVPDNDGYAHQFQLAFMKSLLPLSVRQEALANKGGSPLAKEENSTALLINIPYLTISPEPLTDTPLNTAHQPNNPTTQQLRTSATRHNFITMCRSYPQSSRRQTKAENTSASSPSSSSPSTIFSSATSTTAQTSRSSPTTSGTLGNSTPQQSSGSISPTGSNFSKGSKSFDYSIKHSYGKGYAYSSQN